MDEVSEEEVEPGPEEAGTVVAPPLPGEVPPPPPTGPPIAPGVNRAPYPATVSTPSPVRNAQVAKPFVALGLVGLIGALFIVPFHFRTLAIAIALAGWFAVAVWSLQPHRDAVLLSGASIVAFITPLALRASPWLISVNLVACTLVALHVFSRRGSVLRSSFGGYLYQWVDGLCFSFIGVAVLGRTIRDDNSSSVQRIREWLKQAVVPATVFLVVIGLLAAGDQLFASYFEFLRLDQLLSRAFWAAVGIGLFAAGVGASARPGKGEEDKAAQTHVLEAPSRMVTSTLAALAIALLAFAAVQLSAAALGADYVEGRIDLTYAQWARRGFLSIAVVAVISTITLGLGSVTVARVQEGRRTTQIWASLLAFGTVGVALSAFVKLLVYADQYGLTMLRVYTLIFTVWLGLVALAQLVAIWRPGATWLASAVLASALVGSFAMNVVNPERYVMAHNLDRAHVVLDDKPALGVCDQGSDDCGYVFDLSYSDRMSADAVPTILDELDGLPAGVAEELLDDVCRRDFRSVSGLNYNYSIAKAKRAQDEYCDS